MPVQITPRPRADSTDPRHDAPRLALRALLLSGLILVAGTAAAQSLTPERAEEVLQASRDRLATLAEEPAPGTAEARLRPALQRQIELVEEFVRLAGEAQTRGAEQAEIPARAAAAEARRQALEASAAAAPVVPEVVSREALDAADRELGEMRTEVERLREDVATAATRLDSGLAADTAAAGERAAEAERRAGLLEAELADASEEEVRQLLQVQVANARFEEQVARAAIAALGDEGDFLRAAEPLRALELETREQSLAALEAQFAALAAALQAELESEQIRAEANLARKEQAAETADTPTAKFLAEWEAELARTQTGAGEVQTFIVPLKKDVAEQEKRLAGEKAEEGTLRSLIARSGTAGAAGERISRTLQQLKRRRAVIGRTLQGGQLRQLGTFRERRFKVEDLLLVLNEPFAERRDEFAATLADGDREAFVSRADDLAAELRAALRAERVALGEAIALGTDLQNLFAQRVETLNALERFIRARAFWLRDGKALGPATLEPLGREFGRIQAWVEGLGSRDVRERLAGSFRTTAIVFALVLFAVLPIGLYWARQRIRAITKRVNDRVEQEGRGPRTIATTLFTGVVSAALLPLYVLVAARLVAAAGLPKEVGPVLAGALQHLSLFLFLWFLVRSFYHQRGIAEVQFGMTREATNDFYSATRWLLLGYLLLLAPWQILLAPPFNLSALPRLLYLFFLFTALIGVRLLVRPSSAYVRHRLAPFEGGWLERNWQPISGAIVVLGIAIIVLDVVGYRYSSREIGLSAMLSIGILVVLPALHSACLALVRGVERRRGGSSLETELTGDGEGESEQEVRSRVVRFVNVLFAIGFVVLLAGVWGLDQQALQTLDEVNVYTVRGAGDVQEFVTAADLVRLVLILAVTFWLLGTVPGVYEFALFPRLSVDAGVKYALLTITRYGVFVVGIFLALAEIHLDLGRLGWLMAAVGVGLGFGLQEIVSNFVSGLILLIERPVRPGDVVSVGGMTGTVQRINIRATTIVNFDRQEVMVPNRSLITTEVTNWTRGDTMNRVIIAIGVAYGSDVDQVTDLLQRIAAGQPGVLAEPGPAILFMNHGESSLDFEIRLFVPSPSEMLSVRDGINKRINREFAAYGIEIPFPQRDLHIRTGTLPAAAAGTAPAPG